MMTLLWENKKYFYVDWLYEKKKIKLPINLEPTDNIVVRISGMRSDEYIKDNPELVADPEIFYEALEEAVKSIVRNSNDVFFGYSVASEINFVIRNTHGQTVENVDLVKLATRLTSQVSSIFNIYIDRTFTPKNIMTFKQSILILKNREIKNYLAYRNRFRTTIELNQIAVNNLPSDMIDKEFKRNIERLKRLSPKKYHEYMDNYRLRNGFSFSKDPEFLNIKMPIHFNDKHTFEPLLTKKAVRNLILEDEEQEDNTDEQELYSLDEVK